MLGLMSAGGTAGKGNDAVDVTDAASEFNRLLQTGTASFTTKNAGAYGEAAAPTISMGVLGNGHPSVIIPMERGDIGSNHVAAKERLLFVTGRPVEPHTHVPTRLQFEDTETFNRWLWPKLLRCMIGPLGLPAEVATPAGAKAKLSKARRLPDARNDSDEEGDADETFDPDASGYSIELVDGTASRLRFRKCQGDGGEHLWIAEYRIANRNVPIPEGMTMKKLAERVLNYFSVAHTEIPWTEDALLAHKGICTCFNAECAVRRDEGDVEEAARLGAAPWHLAMLSSALLVLEIAVGEHDDTDDFLKRALAVQEAHVVRGFDLIRLCHAVRRAWQEEAPGIAEEAGALATQALDLASRSQLAAMPPSSVARGPFREWQPTQPSPREPSALDPLSGALADASGVVGTEGEAGEQGAAGANAANVAAEAAPTPTLKLLKPGDPEVPGMDVGYGEGGAQVQRADMGTVIKKDREVMKKTLLRGEARVFGPDVCDSISISVPAENSGQKRARKALCRGHWEAVMKAGLEKYRVGTFVHHSDSEVQDRRGQSYVDLEVPPQNNPEAAAEFHNRLMQLCQLGLATYMDSASKRAEKTAKAKRPRQPPGRADGRVLDVGGSRSAGSAPAVSAMRGAPRAPGE